MLGSTSIKLDEGSELSLRTNEWPKIRIVRGELAMKETKTKKEPKKNREIDYAHVQADYKKSTQPRF